MTERELIDRLKRGDPLAMKSLFDQWHVRLCAIAYRIAGDKSHAQDIVQELFIKLWKRREQLEITASLEAYLKRSCVNASLNFIEREKRTLWVDLQDAIHTLSPLTVEKNMLYAELEIGVDNAIKNLPARTRTVFTLIRTNEMSYKQVAEAMSISEKAVEKEMMKALKLLRTALKPFLNPGVWLLISQSF
jgi:RNA polymerase sigma-70 factor, ECF subfamily